jgi:SAM-dependent methyltransferase
MSDPLTELRHRNRAVWASGVWDKVAPIGHEVGARLIDGIGIEPGMRLLDVGTGTGGSVAIPAASLGARVVGSDLTPELFEHARRRASEAGVEVEWVEADAESLPFEDGWFDRVTSTFGHMFAPRHAVAAAEISRVCRPGGVVGTCTWRPVGFPAAMFETTSPYLPPPPELAEPPLLWGEESHVREMFEPHGLELELEPQTVVFAKPSVEEFMSMYEDHFGPVVTARAALGERWPELRAELMSLFESLNTADDGSCRIDADYLVTVGRKTADG